MDTIDLRELAVIIFELLGVGLAAGLAFVVWPWLLLGVGAVVCFALARRVGSA